MERARWNTELSHKKLNFVICPTFWGHIIRKRPFFCLFPATSNGRNLLVYKPTLL